MTWRQILTSLFYIDSTYTVYVGYVCIVPLGYVFVHRASTHVMACDNCNGPIFCIITSWYIACFTQGLLEDQDWR